MDEIKRLGSIFTQARNRLFDQIVNAPGAGTKTYANTVLRSLEREIAQLQAATGGFVDTTIPAAYRKSLDDTYAYFRRNNLMMQQPEYWAVLHRDAIYDLAREMQHQIGSALITAGRQVQRYVDVARADALRSIGLQQTAVKMASGGTVADMRKSMIKQLQEQGFMTVQYGEGNRARQVGLDTYAQMVARTTTKEAGNIARENQLTENGYDLMMMTSHYPTCAKCAPLQGRVFSISGKDKRFPPLSAAYPTGYHIVHPNCRHVLTPWIEDLASDDERNTAIARGAEPLTDNRTPAEVKLYDAQQAKNRQYRAEQSQYERYKARLGGDAPKTLAAFRRVKRNGAEEWRTMQLDYRRRNSLIEHPETALPNAAEAHIEKAKFKRYFFNPDNQKGWSKGVAFNSHLGYNINNWEDMRAEMLAKAAINPARFEKTSDYGAVYRQPMVLYGRTGNPMDVLTVWEISNTDAPPRLITAMPNRKAGSND